MTRLIVAIGHKRAQEKEDHTFHFFSLQTNMAVMTLHFTTQYDAEKKQDKRQKVNVTSGLDGGGWATDCGEREEADDGGGASCRREKQKRKKRRSQQIE